MVAASGRDTDGVAGKRAEDSDIVTDVRSGDGSTKGSYESLPTAPSFTCQDTMIQHGVD